MFPRIALSVDSHKGGGESSVYSYTNMS